MKVGNILVTKTSAPMRFKNLKPGTFWKVVKVRDRATGQITVGDANHPAIKTSAEYFHILDSQTIREIGLTGNTDLAVRLKAIGKFGPTTVSSAPAGTIEAGNVYIPAEVGKALARMNPGKKVQRLLARG